MPLRRPEPSEYAPAHVGYVSLVPGVDVLAALAAQLEDTQRALRAVSSEASLTRYAPGKWSLREVVGHLIDGERIFAYRALRFARNDHTALPGFEQDDYVAAAHSDSRPWADLLEELNLVRRSTILMFRGFDDAAWERRGVASDAEVSVRAVAYIIAGHERHHMNVIRERYLRA